MRPPEELHTSRLNLRRIRYVDGDTVFEAWAQDEEVVRYVTWKPHKSVNETLLYTRWAEEAWEEGTDYTYLAFNEGNGEAVGTISLRPRGHRVEIGYLVRRSEWGKGYAPEMLEEVIRWAFSCSWFHRVWATCDTDNTRSARVMEKAGMSREGILRSWVVHPNISDLPRDNVVYSIVRQK
jgi:[ribosomal protein S5]-alanine N-acetyltransferase